jgi:hypothetical protein
MPTDHAVATVTVDAPFDEVLATVRAVDGQVEWVPEIREAEVLDRDDEGRPVLARFAAATAVGTDRYTLAYEHRDDGLDWHLVEGRLQTGQEASYTLVARDDASTDVTFDLTVHHNLPLPGFVRGRVIKGLVASTTQGLRAHFED